MNPETGLARPRQPRSNLATNALFTITLMVFALLAETAVDQQRGGIAAASSTRESPGVGALGALGDATMATLGLRDLVRPSFRGEGSEGRVLRGGF